MGIDTHQEAVIYMRADSPVCRSEGFEAHSRVSVEVGDKSIIATLNIVTDELVSAENLSIDEAGLSEVAWRRLGEPGGETAIVRHAPHVESLSLVRSKIFGNELTEQQYTAIVRDIVDGRYADVHLAAFISACGGDNVTDAEVVRLTRAMTNVGEHITWNRDPVLDKHCVGGLPGNRTTPIVVAIVAANELTIPKTSSRAITSPAGTADTMSTITNVNLDLEGIQRVVQQEYGCIAWGGKLGLSPADDILVRVERALDIDSDAQLIASVLSKKAAAGSSHVVIDIPVGPTAKVRSPEAARRMTEVFELVGEQMGMEVNVVRTDGSQPIGRGIGPALEARDLLSVLRQEDGAPEDLQKRALYLAGQVLQMGDVANPFDVAKSTLESGEAWEAFQKICRAQGGLEEPPVADFTHEVNTSSAGEVVRFDNRRIAKVAKLAGAPTDPAAGVYSHVRIGDSVDVGDPLYTIHAEAKGELEYALDFFHADNHFIEIEEK
jgi:thymidine phosphorylase